MVDVRSMMRLTDRLSRTTSGELRSRSRETAARAAEALGYMTGVGWRRADLRRKLVPLSPTLKEAISALHNSDWTQAGKAVRSHFARRKPRFVIDPARRDEFVRTLKARFATAQHDAVNRGDCLLSGRHDLLGYRDLSFTDAGATDWHFDPVHGRRAPSMFWARVPYLDPKIGDHKIIWELNRHQHWLALGRAAWVTGDRRYAEAIATELGSWMQANPPFHG